jgi:hypothetical protein
MLRETIEIAQRCHCTAMPAVPFFYPLPRRRPSGCRLNHGSRASTLTPAFRGDAMNFAYAHPVA